MAKEKSKTPDINDDHKAYSKYLADMSQVSACSMDDLRERGLLMSHREFIETRRLRSAANVSLKKKEQAKLPENMPTLRKKLEDQAYGTLIAVLHAVAADKQRLEEELADLEMEESGFGMFG